MVYFWYTFHRNEFKTPKGHKFIFVCLVLFSPYSIEFDPLFLKRCRAYDNNGVDFDIEMVFRMLKNNHYISDGNADTIVTSRSNERIQL